MSRLPAAALAALAVLLMSSPVHAGPYDGTWQVTRSSTECAHKGKTFTIRIADGVIGGPRRGRVDRSGRFTMAFRNQAKHYTYRGQLGRSRGSGSWARRMFNGRMDCGGWLTLRRLD
ncbi:MAG: hypothetical protein R3D31_05095 [Hyphomicrobiaceae bacterium]